MKITVPKNAFIEALSSLDKLGRNLKNAFPEFRHVRIQADAGSQCVHMAARDLEQQLQFELPDARVEDDLDIAASCAQLQSLVKGCRKDGELTLSADSGTLEVLEDGRSLGQLPLADGENAFPSPEVPGDAETVALPANFSAFVSDAAMCAGKDPTRVQVHGVCICKEGITATDGRELYHVPLPLEGVRSELSLIHTPALASIRRPWRSISTWRGKDRRLAAIRGDGFTYFAAISDGQYPNWRKVVPDDRDLDASIRFADPQRLLLMKFLQGVGKRADEHVELAFGPEQATVTDAAGRKINLPAETDGVRNPGSIAMRAEFLWKAFRLGHGSLRFSPGGRMPLKATGGKGIYIFMPCVPDNPQHPAAATATEPKPAGTEKRPQTAAAGNAVEKPRHGKGFPSPEAPKNTPQAHPPTTPEKPITSQQMKGTQTMEKATRETAAAVPQSNQEKADPEATPIEEASLCLDGIREDIKGITERFQQAARKLKEAMLEQKRQERQYNTALKTLERIRQASGF